MGISSGFDFLIDFGGINPSVSSEQILDAFSASLTLPYSAHFEKSSFVRGSILPLLPWHRQHEDWNILSIFSGIGYVWSYFVWPYMIWKFAARVSNATSQRISLIRNNFFMVVSLNLFTKLWYLSNKWIWTSELMLSFIFLDIAPETGALRSPNEFLITMIYGNYAMIAFHEWDEGIPIHNSGWEQTPGILNYVILIDLSAYYFRGRLWIFFWRFRLCSLFIPQINQEMSLLYLLDWY